MLLLHPIFFPFVSHNSAAWYPHVIPAISVSLKAFGFRIQGAVTQPPQGAPEDVDLLRIHLRGVLPAETWGSQPWSMTQKLGNPWSWWLWVSYRVRVDVMGWYGYSNSQFMVILAGKWHKAKYDVDLSQWPGDTPKTGHWATGAVTGWVLQGSQSSKIYTRCAPPPRQLCLLVYQPH